MQNNIDIKKMLQKLLDKANTESNSRLRLKSWDRMISWNVDGEIFFWKSANGKIIFSDQKKSEICITCSAPVLGKIVKGNLPFFLALWATNELQLNGSFADAFRLGYVFLNDKRGKKIVFLAHCFLNTNARFPGGCAYPGSTVPLIDLFLQNGIGIIQMPCPEFQILGLEKKLYGKLPESNLRKKFGDLARIVIDQIKEYKNYDYKIIGIVGMNPSPSCGVEVSKAKGTMLGKDRDLSEKTGSGVFIEELKIRLKKEKLTDIPVFGFRRILPGELGIKNRLNELKNKFTE